MSCVSVFGQYDQRFNQLEAAERDLEKDQNDLKREREKHLNHTQKVEGDLRKRLEAADEEIKVRWQEFQQRCRKEEAQALEQAKQLKEQRQKLLETEQELKTRYQEIRQRFEKDEAEAASSMPSRSSNNNKNWKKKPRQGSRERAAFAELQRHQVDADTDSSEQEAEEAMRLTEQWAKQQAELNAILREAAALRWAKPKRRCSNNAPSWLTVAERMQRDAKTASLPAQPSDNLGLSQENEELRRMLGEYENRLAQIETPGSQPAQPSKELEDLQGENELLRRLLEEKESFIEEMRTQPASQEGKCPITNQTQIAARGAGAKRRSGKGYEAGTERVPPTTGEKGSGQAQQGNRATAGSQSRTRSGDARKWNWKCPKSVPNFARERIRLDRLREEVRTELERAQRDANVRESMAGVTKLREEITQKRSTTRDDGGRLNDRLRSFSTRLSDTPT